MIETMLRSRLREYGVDLTRLVQWSNPLNFTEVLGVFAQDYPTIEVVIFPFELLDPDKLADRLTDILLERWTQ